MFHDKNNFYSPLFASKIWGLVSKSTQPTPNEKKEKKRLLKMREFPNGWGSMFSIFNLRFGFWESRLSLSQWTTLIAQIFSSPRTWFHISSRFGIIYWPNYSNFWKKTTIQSSVNKFHERHIILITLGT